MTFQQFINKWNGEEADWDGYYAGQCVDLFRYYCDEVLEIKQPDGVYGAANFWYDFDTDPILIANFDKIKNTDDFIPVEGDVALWDWDISGGYGHIGMVSGSDHTTLYFHSFDQNWTQLSVCKIEKHNYNLFLGVLRPKKEENMPTDLETCLSDRKKFWDERDAMYRALEVNTQNDALAKINELMNHECPENPIAPIGELPPEKITIGNTKMAINGLVYKGGNYAIEEPK